MFFCAEKGVINVKFMIPFTQTEHFFLMLALKSERLKQSKWHQKGNYLRQEAEFIHCAMFLHLWLFRVLYFPVVYTVLTHNSVQLTLSRHLRIDNLLSNNFLIKITSNSFWSLKNCKNPILKVNFICQKSAESFWNWFSFENMYKKSRRTFIRDIFSLLNFFCTLFWK